MVMARDPSVDLLLPPAVRATDEMQSGAQKDRGHTDLREAELVGPVERSLLRERFVGKLAALRRGSRCNVAIERRLAEPDPGEVGGASPDVATIEVEVRHDAPGRERR